MRSVLPLRGDEVKVRKELWKPIEGKSDDVKQ